MIIIALLFHTLCRLCVLDIITWKALRAIKFCSRLKAIGGLRGSSCEKNSKEKTVPAGQLTWLFLPQVHLKLRPEASEKSASSSYHKNVLSSSTLLNTLLKVYGYHSDFIHAFELNEKCDHILYSTLFSFLSHADQRLWINCVLRLD